MLRMLLLLLLACAAAAAGARGDPTQAVIDEAHAKSVALRRQLLAAWTFDADASPSSGYYASFAGAPIQHIIAAMALNENQTAVALAQEALANPNMSSHFGSVYEWTCVARAFAMFNSRSGWTASSVATMRASTEESMKNMTFHYAVEMCGTDKFCGGVAPSQGGGSMCTSGSENLDYDAKSSCYISLRELAKFPEYKDRPLGAPPPPPPPPGPLPEALPELLPRRLRAQMLLRAASCAAEVLLPASVRKNAFLEPFLYKKDPFAKTGSRQA